MTDSFRPGALIPTYDNPDTIESVVARVGVHLPVVVVDDGSGPRARAVLDRLESEGKIALVRRPANGGKGAAVKTGFAAMLEMGYTHALQVDADGQHNIEDIPRFVAAGEAHPEALVLGAPTFDASAPRARRWGRVLSQVLVHVQTLGRVIQDPLCGFRLYPLEPADRAAARGDAMDFDPEVIVRIAWLGVPVLNLFTKVRYLDEDEGGVSHFRMGRDNLLIAWGHTRMITALLWRVFRRPWPKRIAMPALEHAQRNSPSSTMGTEGSREELRP